MMVTNSTELAGHAGCILTIKALLKTMGLLSVKKGKFSSSIGFKNSVKLCLFSVF